MKQRNKFKNKDQFQLNFQAGSSSFQQKEKELNSLVKSRETDKTQSNEVTQFVPTDKTGHSVGAFNLVASQKSQSKDLSKKSAGSKVKKISCRSKQPQALLFDNLITVEELAVIFGLAPQTIRNWVALGKLPYVKIGKRNLFLKGSLQEWLNRKEKSQWQ